MEYRDVMLKRRSTYVLKPASPVSDDVLIKRLKEALNEAPSAYNGQSPRLVICFGDAHKKVWEITKATLRKTVPADAFPRTEAKLNGFEAAYGTLLLYTDMPTVEGLIKRYPLYAEKEEPWAHQTIGIAVLTLWETLIDLGLAANMQHYNPLIDKEVAKAFGVPDGWRLECQIVFGTEGAKPGPKDYLPIDRRVLIAK